MKVLGGRGEDRRMEGTIDDFLIGGNASTEEHEGGGN